MQKILLSPLLFFLIVPSFSFAQEKDPISNIIGISKYSGGFGIYYERFFSHKWSIGGNASYWYDHQDDYAFSLNGTFYPIGNVYRPFISLGAFSGYSQYGSEIGFPRDVSSGLEWSLGFSYFPSGENIQIKVEENFYTFIPQSDEKLSFGTASLSLGYRF